MSEAKNEIRLDAIVMRPWWRRVTFAVELRITGIESGETPRQWLFNYEAAIQKLYKGRKVFWPRAWIKIAGVSFGLGAYVDYDA
jgi:hypothetical protein